MIVPPPRRCPPVSFLICLIGLGIWAGAPFSSTLVARARQFASGVSLVEVYATVTDRRGEPVVGLSQADFTVEENGRPQVISAFAAGEFPLAVAGALDRSFSMPSERLAGAVAAARAFVQALKSSDQVLILAIGSETETLAPLSANHAAALAALDRVEPWGTTPLYEAILAAIDAIQPAIGRRALILMSDGDDRYSSARAADVVEYARNRDVLVYPIALGRTRPPIFAELAVVTAGRSFFVSDPRALHTTLQTIAQGLRFQFLVGYVPARPVADRPEWRSIRVTINRPGVRVRARGGSQSSCSFVTSWCSCAI